jgi:striatin 1/3/4
MSAHLDAVTSLDMDPSGMAFVSGGHDASIRLWDMSMTKTCIQEFSAHRKKGDEGVLDIQYHRAFPWMVSGGADGIVKVYHQGH